MAGMNGIKNPTQSNFINLDEDTGRNGFQQWECYMLLKYGNAGSFGLGGKSEYLIELPLYPDEVTESINANWDEQQILGRSSSIAAFAGTSLKSVNFNLDLHRDLLTGSYSLTDQNLREIAKENNVPYDAGENKKGVPLGADTLHHQAAGLQKDYMGGAFGGRAWYVSINKMLQMSCYPQYTDYGAIPPTTYFIFGQMILKGFVESYSTTWKKPIINTFYGWNSVGITMKCYPDSVITANDIISGDTSTQNTYSTKFPSKGGTSNVMNIKQHDNYNRHTMRNNSLKEDFRSGNVIGT